MRRKKKTIFPRTSAVMPKHTRVQRIMRQLNRDISVKFECKDDERIASVLKQIASNDESVIRVHGKSRQSDIEELEALYLRLKGRYPNFEHGNDEFILI